VRTPEELVRELETVRKQQADLETRYAALRKELLDLCVPRRQFQIPPYVIQVARFTKWKSGVVKWLAEHEHYSALRPVNEVLDRMYSEGTVVFSDLAPFLERSGLSYRLVRPEPTDPMFAGAYAKSIRSQFAATAVEPTPFEEATLQSLTEKLLAAANESD
jgi:hypothetical protein